MPTSPLPSRAEINSKILSEEHLSSDLGRRTINGGLIAMAAQVLKLALQLGQAALLARLLAPGDFGLIAMAGTVTGFVGMFTDLGLSAATVQRKSLDQDTVSAMFLLNLATGFIVMLVCILSAPLVGWFFNDPRVVWVLVVLSLTIPLSAATAQHWALLSRRMQWVSIQWIGLLSQGLGLVAAVLLAWKTDAGYWALVASAWTSATVNFVAIWFTCRWRPTWVTDWSGAKSSLRFGGFLTGFSFVNYFHRQLDNVLIGWRWGPQELGYYSRAYTLLTLPIALINNPISSAILPGLSRLQSDPTRWARAYIEGLGVITFLGSGIAAVSVATSDHLVTVLFGPGWSESSEIFRILAISMFAATPMNATGWIFLSLGQTGRMFKWACLATPMISVSFVIGLPYGPKGLALAYSVSMWLIFVPCFAFATKNAPVALRSALQTVLPLMSCGVVSAMIGIQLEGLLALSSPLLNVIIVGAATGLIYVIFVGTSATVSISVRCLLRSMFDRIYKRLKPALE